MRRQRLLTLTLVSFLLLCLTVICANASWFIQDKNQGSGVLNTFAANEDTSAYFTTGPAGGGSYVFDAGITDITPTLNSAGASILGGTASDYTVTWVGCQPWVAEKPIEKNPASPNDTAPLEGVIAGTHYYKIVENATGQVISSNHAVTVEKRAVTVSTPSKKVGFVGNTISWSHSVYGITSDGGNYPFDENSASFSHTYTLKVSDYSATGYTTSTSAHSASTSIPEANTGTGTRTGNGLEVVSEHHIVHSRGSNHDRVGIVYLSSDVIYCFVQLIGADSRNFIQKLNFHFNSLSYLGFFWAKSFMKATSASTPS